MQPQFPQLTPELGSVRLEVITASGDPAPGIHSWRRGSAGKTGSWIGVAGRKTPAHLSWSEGTKLTPLCLAAPRGRGPERAGESG